MAKNITKEQIIEKTMELILEKGCSEALTIREIAKAMKCTHPNIYNYYDSINDLMWDVLAEILNEMVESVLANMSKIEGDEQYEIFIKQYLRFCFEKMAWYRVIWFDRFIGEMPDRVKENVKMPAKRFPEILIKLIPEIKDIDQAEKIGRIINIYIRGAVGTFVTGRAALEDKNKTIDEITEDIKKITYALLEEEKR